MPEPGFSSRKRNSASSLSRSVGQTCTRVEQVGPGEAGDEDPRLAQVQQLDDVAAHGVGGRGRQGDRRRIAQLRAEAAQPGVVGAKIVPPLADAVRLVDRQQPQPAAPHRVDETAGCETARARRRPACTAPAAMRSSRARLLVGRERAVDERGRQPARCERSTWSFISAINGETTSVTPVLRDGRQLVAEALAAAGRHHAQAILAGQHGFDHLALARAKAGQPERGQIGFKVVGGRGHEQLARRLARSGEQVWPHYRRAGSAHKRAGVCGMGDV